MKKRTVTIFSPRYEAFDGWTGERTGIIGGYPICTVEVPDGPSAPEARAEIAPTAGSDGDNNEGATRNERA